MKSSSPNALEPIAIIGIGCRFPGDAANPQEFWKMLCEGKDAIIDVPKDRWDSRRYYDSQVNVSGKMYVKQGGFLRQKWEDFDAEFFHISPREANFLDPQQRLLMELTWEALEDGGIVPEKIRNTETGVFIGAFTTDWQSLQNNPYNLQHCSMYSGINGSMTILSARLAFFFDLKGPCLTIDTACSSSLVAVHLACQSLWEKNASLAIAGGVNAMLIPETTIAMSKGKFLNPEGRCRPFDSKAMGYVRGEGGGIVILKPLSDAIRDQDPIYALIRGTGVNHDGYTQGIAQPNPEAQKALIKKVLNEAQINPADIHYVEAHGTGTPVGDPIEAMAINEVLQDPLREYPCYLGAVKSNIGHLEAAAGIAGLIKAALCLKHEKIPPNLHFEVANPIIPFEKYCLKVPMQIESFPKIDKPLYAGVNAFGYGGTNAHAILEGFKRNSVEFSSENPLFIPFSAKNQDGLRDIAKIYKDYLDKNPDVNLADIAFTLSQRRSLFNHRLAVSAGLNEELKNKLNQFIQGDKPEGSFQGKCFETKPKLAFVYTGMGPQWWGMGRELLQTSPDFLKIVEFCDRKLIPLSEWSILEELNKSEKDSRIEDPVVAQVLNYVLQAGLTEVMKLRGIVPDAIIGHSIGEVAAAYASGILSLEEGLLVAYYRATIQSIQKNKGTMLAAGMSLQEVQLILAQYDGRISLAAVNGPQSATLAGNREDLEKIVLTLDKENIFNRFLRVNVAYHSHQMELLQQQVLDTLHFLQPKRAIIPFYSTVFGELLDDIPLNADYWWKNIRQPVLFAQAMQDMLKRGYQLFVEIGPHPVLSSFIKENIMFCKVEGESLPSLNRKKSESISLMECAGGLFVKGYSIPFTNSSFIKLPTYPWQKKTYWIESEESRQYRLSAQNHVMLSRRMPTPNPTWQIEVNRQFFPWLEDHKLEGSIVFPGAGYIEAALAIYGTFPCIIEQIAFEKPLVASIEKESLLQISLDENSKIFNVHSSPSGEKWDWTRHATGKFSLYVPKQPIETIDLEILKNQACIDSQIIYDQFTHQGLEYGSSFRSIIKMWKGTHEALSEIKIIDSADVYHLHPTLLDAALQTLIGTVDSKLFGEGLIVPSHIDQFTFYSAPKSIAYCHARSTKLTSEKVVGDLILCDALGHVCVQIKGLHCRLLPSSKLKDPSNLLYQFEWEENPLNPELTNHENQVWVSGSQYDQATYQDIPNLNIYLEYESGPAHVPSALEEIDLVNDCVNLMKAIEVSRSVLKTTLWIVTQGTLRGSSLRGLSRVIRQEYPRVRVRLIDLDPNMSFDSNIIKNEAAYTNSDDEIKWANGKRYTNKLKKTKYFESINQTLSTYALELKTPGLIDSLYYKEIEKREPAHDEVCIEVHSTSLNFKDLMKVLGMLDQNVLEGTYFGSSFGMECSGTIVSVGSKVKKFAIGDTVCAFAQNTFQSHITVSARCIYAIPPSTKLEEAPIYIPFITVLRALKDIAELKKGEWILIHSATGAVGLAAIQYAQYIGAHIIGTAGSEEKRKYLRSLGIQYCSNSRSLEFADDVLKWTGGKGVDVILNSLSGEALTKSLSLLAPYGRFIEIGKRDISMNSPLPMRHFNNNTSFTSIDLDRTFIDNPKLIQRLLMQTYNLFEKGIFKSLPCEFFSANQPVKAFQFMAHSKHIGKIMLRFDSQKVQGIPLKPFVNPNASYLITGGLSGFGFSVALWLAEKGAKHLVLLGRKGATSVETTDAIEQLRKEGVNVKVAAVDVTEINQMRSLFDQCDKEMPPIKGIIHSAMVLNDSFIPQLTLESIRDTLLPKIGGCLNLHNLTQHRSLDFFVLFSSISSLIGNPGQGNYAAANAFLDSFCHHRKKMNLPALTINWGALNAGVITRNAQVAKHLESHGIKAIPKKAALKILEDAIKQNHPQVCAFDVNWTTLMQRMPNIKQSKTFSEFCTDNNSPISSINLTDENTVIELIKETVAKILKIDPLKLDPTIRLNNLGMDSLMAMELQTTIEVTLGIKIPTMELMKGPSIKQLVHSVRNLLI